MYNPQVPAWDRWDLQQETNLCGKRGKKRPQKESINKDIVLGKKATSWQLNRVASPGFRHPDEDGKLNSRHPWSKFQLLSATSHSLLHFFIKEVKVTRKCFKDFTTLQLPNQFWQIWIAWPRHWSHGKTECTHEIRSREAVKEGCYGTQEGTVAMLLHSVDPPKDVHLVVYCSVFPSHLGNLKKKWDYWYQLLSAGWRQLMWFCFKARTNT